MWAGISDHRKSPLKIMNLLSLEAVSKIKTSGNKEGTGWGCTLAIREIYSKSL